MTLPRLKKFLENPQAATFELNMENTDKLDRLISGLPTLQGLPGKDGYTPIKGEDYFTPAEVDQFKTEVTPIKGKDYFDGEPGKDGKDGADGTTPTVDEDGIAKRVFSKIKVRDGVDGKDGTPGKDGQNGKDGSPDTGDQIRDKLSKLKGDKRLSASAIKDFPELTPDELLAKLVKIPINQRSVLVPKQNAADGDLRWHGGGGQVNAVVAGTNITVDNTDPANPIINSTGGGGTPATPLNSLQFNNSGAFGGTKILYG